MRTQSNVLALKIANWRSFFITFEMLPTAFHNDMLWMNGFIEKIEILCYCIMMTDDIGSVLRFTMRRCFDRDEMNMFEQFTIQNLITQMAKWYNWINGHIVISYVLYNVASIPKQNDIIIKYVISMWSVLISGNWR